MAKTANQTETQSFLPDFCGLRMVFAVVVLSELFALILALSGSERAGLWDRLALISLFVQWTGLLGAGLLCLLRRLLERLPEAGAAAAGYLLLLAIVALLSEASYRVLNTTLPQETPDHLEFLCRNVAIGAIVIGIILRYFYVRFQWQRQVRAESEARFQALQARIRPHFLFNTLNTAAALVHDRPDTAEAALEDLADLFRASLGDERQIVPLEQELELARHYLQIEQLRLGERLRVEWSIEAGCERVPLPLLTLQPLVENAVYHGIEPLPGGGTVTITAGRVAGGICVEVTNPLPAGPASRSGGQQMALENIRQRLHARFGEAGKLVTQRSGDQHRISVVLPIQGES